ncbi:MAG: hypothetical protein B6229_07345 [Spirochaetaceae bacterium 4572_7]|nr:MAG: hypothetical protein B6229_07345 [Spirochaetaceae bacterium 4572_7]
MEDVSYPHKILDLHINKDVIPHLKWAKNNGFLLIIVTNQAGIAKGKFTLDQYEEFQEELEIRLLNLGIEIDKTYYCPYHKDGVIPEFTKDSEDRKPKLGMFMKSKVDFNIDFKKSYMIGDKFSDRIKGIKSYILESSYTKGQSGTFIDTDAVFKEIKNDLQ